MANYPVNKPVRLRNPPIKEALIDLKVRLSKDFDIKQLSTAHESTKELYPQKGVLPRSEFRLFGRKPGKIEQTSAPEERGYRFISEDGNQIVQFRFDGFTFSRLKQYENWANIKEEAWRLWKLYKEVAEPESILRVALRYINRFEVPIPVRFADYLKAPPTVPDGLPQNINSFLSRLVLQEESIGATAIISQSLDQSQDENFVGIILDIDVFRAKDYGMAEKQVWAFLEELRKFKNAVFFNSITDKTVELFQ